MSTSVSLAQPQALPQPAPTLALTVGAYFGLRIALTYLFFQSDPRLGTFADIALGCTLAAAAAASDHASLRLANVRRNPVLRWLMAYLCLVGLSVAWTGTESPAVAFGYWTGEVTDVMAVLLLLHSRTFSVMESAQGVLRGYVSGALVVATVAWISPTLPDMRIGNTEFLHPNGLGLEFALATFVAQRLSVERPAYRWTAIALFATLLRTLSKTSIIALLLVEVMYMVRRRDLRRGPRIRLAAAGLAVLGAFSGLLLRYADLYANTGSSPETLTGRTAIWTAALLTGLEQPWFGHGLYSFRFLMPAFGDFEPWHAHNELLQHFFEFGVAGVVLMLALYGSLILFARRQRAHSFGVLASSLALFGLIHGITDTINFGLSLPLWMFALFAIALATKDAPGHEEL